MRINWGTAIIIAFGLFMTFILYFVFKVQSDSKYDNELVVEDYYKQELLVDERMKKEKQAADLEEKVTIKTTQEGISIQFPQGFDIDKIEGKVSLYRPSNQKLDFEIPLSLSDSHLLIPKNSLVGGRWDISVDWKYEEKEFLSNKTVYY